MRIVDSKIEFDSTDHFEIHCVKCNKMSRVKKVEKRTLDNGEHCTHIYSQCPKCKDYLKRKIYWNNKDLKPIVGS